MLGRVSGSSFLGVETATIAVEVNLNTDLSDDPVRLSDRAVTGSNFRKQPALKNVPGKNTTLTMASAYRNQEGPAYAFHAVLGDLLASHQIRTNKQVPGYEVLRGPAQCKHLQLVRGALPMAITVRQNGFRAFITKRHIIKTKQYLSVERKSCLG